MDVSLTWLAKWKIRRHGGELWIWVTPAANPAWGLIRTASSAPLGMEFEPVETGGVRLWFDCDFPINAVLIEWTPLAGFDVIWEGTGSAAGAGG